MRKRWLCVLGVLLIFLTSCSQTNGVSSDGAKVDEIAKRVSAGVGLEKYNAYIEFSNHAGGQWFNAIIQGYFDRFGYEDTLSVPEDSLDEGFYEDMYETQMEKALPVRENLEKKPDYGDADIQIAALCDSYEKLVGLYFQDVTDYYTQKQYQSDQYEKGQTLHTAMLEAYADYSDQYMEFYWAFNPIIFEVEGAGLEQMEQNEYFINYHTLALLLDAKQLGNLIDEAEWSERPLYEIDMEHFKPYYDSFLAHLSQLATYQTDEAQQKKEGLSSSQFAELNNIITLARAAKDRLTNTYQVIEAGSDAIETTEGDGTYGSVENMLSAMIDSYNRFIESE